MFSHRLRQLALVALRCTWGMSEWVNLCSIVTDIFYDTATSSKDERISYRRSTTRDIGCPLGSHVVRACFFLCVKCWLFLYYVDDLRREKGVKEQLKEVISRRNKKTMELGHQRKINCKINK